MTNLTPAEKQILAWRADYAVFARDRLRIRDKNGDMVPFEFWGSQKELHRSIEAQKAETGWVRKLVLKGRQQGISTYIAGRYYWRATLWSGRAVYILSHEQASSDTLFDMVERFHRHDPFAPHAGTSNAKELVFDKLESSYTVATAGQKAGGRGKAISLFHGSEAAFWANAPDHFAASVQGVPLAANTEIILESTSAGPMGEFYERCQMAQQSLGDYQMDFLRWTMQAEYAREPEPGFELSKESDDEDDLSEAEYAELYDVTMPQMAWRRNKILELRDPDLFRREYPMDSEEAFSDTKADASYIRAKTVLRARKRKVDAAGPLIVGVDPASGGGDRFAISRRRGDRILKVEFRKKVEHLEAVAWLTDIIDTENPSRMNIDLGNIGSAIVSSLKAKGPKYAKIVRGVNFGGTSQAKLARPKAPGPKNRRAEMARRLRTWLLGEVQIPDQSALQADLCGPRQKPLPSNDFMLESKADMKKRGLPSCDLFDSCMLTFASNEYFETWDDGRGVVVRPVPQAEEKPTLVDKAPDSTYFSEGSGASSWME